MSIGHTEERLMLLANRLIAATEKGRVEWTSASETNTAFKASQRSGSVLIASDDGDGAYPYTLTVFDEGGRKVESLTTGAYPDVDMGSDPYEWNDTWRKLYESARGQALKIDSVINAIIDDLDSDDIPF
jgi:hypothetical protein